MDRAIDVIDDVLGLNAQGSLNVQLSLWNRVSCLDTGFLPRALQEDRSLVKTWLMRDTVHIVSTRRFPVFWRALEGNLMREWNRWTMQTGAKASPTSWERFYRIILDALEGGPLTLAQIHEATGWPLNGSRPSLSRVLREMSLRGIVCHAWASGPWHHTTEYAFARMDGWLPNVDLESISEEEALTSLARGYLKTYGPASVMDFCYWSGMRVQDARLSFESLSDSLMEVTIKGKGRLMILKEDEQALFEVKDIVAPVRLLPQFDTLILGHRDKTRFIEPSTRNMIVLPRGQVAATVMIDGRVKGTWTMRKKAESWRLEINPFEELSEERIDEVEAEGELLSEFTGFEIDVVWNTKS